MRRDTQFRFEYDPATIRFGTGTVGDLSTELERAGLARALVVTGSTVGNTPEVMDPITEGLGEHLVGTFAETTPEKRLETAVRGFDAMREHDADVLISVGGGSSLDVAKVISVIAADDRSPEKIGRELEKTGSISVGEASPVPIIAIPTTLAGADLSVVAGVTARPSSDLVSEPVNGGLSDPRLMPRVAVYDPALFATTPREILCSSAMNGFDKGIESLYARNATPVTDATAVRGLRLLRKNLGGLGDESIDEELLEPIIKGTILVQYGVSRPGETTLSLIHAFGHGLTGGYDLHQGVAHAVVAPHVLRYLFDNVDGRRALLAEGFEVNPQMDSADGVVTAVEHVRHSLGLPTQLRDVNGPDPEEFETVAKTILDDSFMRNVPPGLAPTVSDIVGVLRDAY